MNNFQRPDRIEKALAEKGVYASKTDGTSMEPMLVRGRDTVVIKPAVFPLKKYDIPVYHRGNQYVMHRVVRVTKKGYVICGDNMIELERDIRDCDVVGVLGAFYHDGKYVEYGDREYIRYAKRAVRTYPLRVLRRVLYKIKRILKGLLQAK